MVAPRDLEQPLLLHSTSRVSETSTLGDKSYWQFHLGSDAQRSAWFLLCVCLILFFEATYRCYAGTRYILSSTVYVVGLLFVFWGLCLFVKAAYPDEIVKSCFYANKCVTPPPGSWCCRVHCGTRVLRGGQFQFVGAVLCSLATILWIQEDYLYEGEEEVKTWDYASMLGGSFLLVAGCYYQLLGQYPDSVLGRASNRELTDLQSAGWCFELFSVVWLVRSAYAFDDGAGTDELKWLKNCFVSTLMALGSYFMLAQSYREGTRMDAVFLEKAAEPLTPPELTTREGKEIFDPLMGISDLSDSKTVLRRARKLINDESLWVMTAANEGSVRVWIHREVHAVRFETDIFQNQETRRNPLELAAVVQSEVFKRFQLRSAAGGGVSVVGKLGNSSSAPIVMRTLYPPNPPMPAHECTFASFLNESREAAELTEWSVDKQAPVSAFRYFVVSRDVFFRGLVWLEDISRWMPDFLLQAEMRKVPFLVSELELFLKNEKAMMESVSGSLKNWIWQKIHLSISPLAATVLVRTSPSYRLLLAKNSGLRTKVPDPVVLVAGGALRHPLEYFPASLSELGEKKLNVGEATKHGSDFISNEFGAWKLSEKSSKIISVFRQELQGESVAPFRIQARVHGIDPLTLATLVHRNKLGELIEKYNAPSSDPLHSSATPPDQSSASNLQSVLISVMGETVSNNLIAESHRGALRVYRERKRSTRLLVGAREREITLASVMRDTGPLKAVVVHFGIDEAAKSRRRRFHAWSFENDGGSDCRVTWGGLLKVGSELRQKKKMMEKLVNLFIIDSLAKQALVETHLCIAYSTLKAAVANEVKKFSIAYLEKDSDYAALMAEIAPADLAFEAQVVQDEDDDDDSVVTMPLSPVESHLRMSADENEEDKEHEVASERNPL